MKAKKKAVIAIIFASTALGMYAFSYYLMSTPHSPYAAFGFLLTFVVDIAAMAAVDVLDDGSKSNREAGHPDSPRAAAGSVSRRDNRQ